MGQLSLSRALEGHLKALDNSFTTFAMLEKGAEYTDEDSSN